MIPALDKVGTAVPRRPPFGSRIHLRTTRSLFTTVLLAFTLLAPSLRAASAPDFTAPLRSTGPSGSPSPR
jgi:hypothetical protein